MIKTEPSSSKTDKRPFSFPEVGVPFFWPFALFMGYEEKGMEELRDGLKFLNEVEQTDVDKLMPEWASENHIELELHTVRIKSFDQGAKIPTLIIAPYAGHTSTVVDFGPKQSLVATLIDNGVKGVYATDWKSATPEMSSYDIDNYLSDLTVCVDHLGGKVNLAGMCQGGWLCAMFAARFPDKVNSMILAGAPINTDAGNGIIKQYANKYPMEFYQELVSMGGGNLKGEFMLEGFKSMNPEKEYFEKYVELYEHIEDPTYVERFDHFERWYEHTISLPGKWYLQVVKELFKENRLFKGEFIALGKKISLRDVVCPVYLLAGESDDITPKEQVFDAEKVLGTPSTSIVKETAKGGHIGLFMGSTPLRENWPHIAEWLKHNSEGTK